MRGGVVVTMGIVAKLCGVAVSEAESAFVGAAECVAAQAARRGLLSLLLDDARAIEESATRSRSRRRSRGGSRGDDVASAFFFAQQK